MPGLVDAKLRQVKSYHTSAALELPATANKLSVIQLSGEN